ncbi:UDP-N-acetylmuramoyl-tripeptide--D-alanyl-D-alanine ligase [Chitinilyticum litopenaei]|uniref:UDP-N-acetylmuramoyl-tripeptide--D-alanyl-D- alanine ligase n=1 Tax=Chitinilyticum litopenaei TaxID=1121276 RepID=UPI00041F84E9|nr:UDP-N-acetylmuramoyl-tripeptide--D-alanyl-D-alanine ligase [Chitinilyticum litopenaei]
MMLSLRETATALSAELLGDDAQAFARVTTDSRALQPGDLFVALKGERFDAHDFVPAALAGGAAAALVDHAVPDCAPQLVVKDTLQGLGQLAHYWRGLHDDTPLIAITGSNGKTSVKEMCASIFAAAAGDAAAVHATQGNLNNHIGLPLTVLGMRAEHRYVVAEMGMNHFGEIDYLTRIARPDVALVNNAGAAHLEALGSVAGVARAKGEIFAGLKADGVAIINADDEFAPLWRELAGPWRQLSFGLGAEADIGARALASDALTSRFELVIGGATASVTLAVPGQHNVRNALAAAACAHALGVPLATIAQGLTAWQGVKGRLQRKLAANGATVLDDSYNANPDSMKAAIDVLAGIPGDTILVLGDMGEVGSDAPQRHAEIGAYARDKHIAALFTLGEHMAETARAFGSTHFATLAELLAALDARCAPHSTVLVKGSRFMKMERVADALVHGTLVADTPKGEK